MNSDRTSSRISAFLAGSIVLFMVLVIVYQIFWKDADSEIAADPWAKNAKATNDRRNDRSLGPRAQYPDGEADRMLAAKNLKTDISLPEFPAREYQRLPRPAGKAAGAPPGEAYIHVPSAGRRVIMESNQLGEFPAITTKLNDTVGVRVSLDGVKPGTPVRVVILDGGTFPIQEGAAMLMKAAEWRGVAFDYTTSANIGTHRVLVQPVGQPSRIFDFNALDSNEG